MNSYNTIIWPYGNKSQASALRRNMPLKFTKPTQVRELNNPRTIFAYCVGVLGVTSGFRVTRSDYVKNLLDFKTTNGFENASKGKTKNIRFVKYISTLLTNCEWTFNINRRFKLKENL